jgi:CarD family transcriptional regulator
VLRTAEKPLANQSWNRRQREYTDMLNSGSVIEIAKVLRDVHRSDGEKELSYSERRVYDQAKALLIDEIALACKCSASQAEGVIDQALAIGNRDIANGSNPLKLLASHRAC